MFTQHGGAGRSSADPGTTSRHSSQNIDGNENPEVGNLEWANHEFLRLRTGTPVRHPGSPSGLKRLPPETQILIGELEDEHRRDFPKDAPVRKVSWQKSASSFPRMFGRRSTSPSRKVHSS